MSKEAKKGDVLPLRGKPEKITRTKVDTIAFTQEEAASWKLPPIQRGLAITDKVLDVVDVIRDNDGVIPGIMTFGILNGETFVVDGQHRIYAFKQSECRTGYADVRYCYFDSMAELGAEFARLNRSLVRMKPDDFLRALEPAMPAISLIRKRCPNMAFNPGKKSGNNKVSMSLALRAWSNSTKNTPRSHGLQASAEEIVCRMDETELDQFTMFMKLCFNAWGDLVESARLWGGLNLALCMWLYQRTVIGRHSARSAKLDDALFQKCLSTVGRDAEYYDWLRAKNTSEKSRSPAYDRLKKDFTKTIESETGGKVCLPQPDWQKS